MNDVSDGIVLLGAEMLTWSDLDGDLGPFDGLLAPQLTNGFAGPRRRALIAGPTSAQVICAIAGQFVGVDVLVRSWLDAHALRAELSDEITILCGPLRRMIRAGEGYDAVVALAGLDRLHSAEDDRPALRETLSALVGQLADGGDLLVGVGNDAGVDRLLSLDPAMRNTDATWPEGKAAGADPDDLGAVVEALSDHGLAVVDTWFCHGRRSAPLVAARERTFAAFANDSVLVREIGRAYDVADPSAPTLKDPAEITRVLVRAGLGAATAPLAVVHLRSAGAAPAPGEDEVLVQEPGHDGSPATGYRLEFQGAGWRRTLLGEAARHRVASGLTRDTGTLTGELPSGETLAVELERCVAEHDLTAAGALVRRFRDFLGASGSIVSPDRVPLLPRAVAVTGTGLVELDRGWRADEGAPLEVVLVRGLLDVAADLLGRAVRHPWSPAASARLVAIALAAAGGVEVDAELVAAAQVLDAKLRPAGQGLDIDVPGNLGRLTYAELLELTGSLADRAAAADEHIAWLLRRMQARQRMLRLARGQINAYESSRELWIGRRVLVVRSAVRRWRRRREATRSIPAGQWTGGGKNPDDDESRIEAELVPPGYEPSGGIEIVPTVDPPLDPTIDPAANPD